MHQRVLILGGGGHAKGVIEILRLVRPTAELAILDPSLEPGCQVQGVLVIGGDEALERAASQGYRAFAMGFGGVGDNLPRARAFARAQAAGLSPLTLVHPSAIVSPSARLGDGTQCLWGAIIGADARIGADVIVNSGSVIEHDCRVDDHAHVSSGAVLAGAVTVASLAHIGAGAVVRQGLTIGKAAVVGAGAVVVQSVDAGETVVGVPARVLLASRGLKT